jgi:hypothetical protein
LEKEMLRGKAGRGKERTKNGRQTKGIEGLTGGKEDRKERKGT